MAKKKAEVIPTIEETPVFGNEPVETVPGEQQIVAKKTDIVKQSTALTITTQSDCELATGVLKEIKGLRAQIAETFSPIVQAAHATWKKAIEQRDGHDKPLALAEATIKNKMGAYLAEQERQRREAEAKAQAEAQRAAEEQAAAEAMALEEMGETEAAQAVVAAPVVAPVVTIKPTPKPTGIATALIWKFRITDASKIPLQYMVPNEQAIGAVVRALKDKTQIAGVEVYAENCVRVSR